MKKYRTLLKLAAAAIVLSWLTSSCAGFGVDLDYGDDGYYGGGGPYWSGGYNGSIYSPIFGPDIVYPYPSGPIYRPIGPAMPPPRPIPPQQPPQRPVNPGLNRPSLPTTAPDGAQRPGSWNRPGNGGSAPANPPSIPRGENVRGR